MPTSPPTDRLRPRALAAAVIASACAALAGCGHSAQHVYDDRPREDVWHAVVQAAKEPRYSDWIVTENKVHVSEADHRVDILRDLKRDVVEKGAKPRREEAQWRFAATLLPGDPPTVELSSPDWTVPAHFWKEADHFFAQVRLRLAEMGPVTPAPGDPMGGAPAAAAKDPTPPGNKPEKPADGKLATP
ncbi:MAG: hypothetical protein U0625_05725 [Phycisphaerales bacterium]